LHQTVQLLGINMKKVYIHTPDMPGWDTTLVEILEKMDRSGMIAGVDEINICANGIFSNMQMRLLPLLNSNPKFKLVQVNGDAAKWEWPTINRLKADADASDSDDIICYTHLKGLTRLMDQKTIDWRNYLCYWTIERWQDSLDKINEGHELVGVNWMDQPWSHLSGNMWWTTTNYLRRLPKLQDPSTITQGQVSKLLKPNIVLDPGNVRYECEAWIGQGKPNVFNLHSSHSKSDPSFHYNNEYPATNYRAE
jgi:hypothetical protein